MNNKTVQIKSLEEYIKVIHSIRNNALIDLFFRGQSNEEYELITSIGRQINKKSNQTKLILEKDYIKEALFRYPKVFGNQSSYIDLLTQLQHYGVPTRLLDVTSNPLVALYFACKSSQESKDKNGEVFVFNMTPEDTYDNEYVDVIASVGYLHSFFPVSFLNHLETYEVELKPSPNQHTSNYENIIINTRFPILIRQKNSFERQKAQSGYYMLFSNRLEYNESLEEKSSESDILSNCRGLYFSDIIDPINQEDDKVKSIIKIGSEYKNTILSQLKSVNIDESTMFPEDIDRGCRMMVNDLEKHQYYKVTV